MKTNGIEMRKIFVSTMKRDDIVDDYTMVEVSGTQILSNGDDLKWSETSEIKEDKVKYEAI
jgi:uncharacterized protein YjcR